MRLGTAAELKRILTLSADSVSINPFAVLAASFYNSDMAMAIAEASHVTGKPILAETQEYVFTADGSRPFIDGVRQYIDLFRPIDYFEDAQIFLGVDHFSNMGNLDGLLEVMRLNEISFAMIDGSKLDSFDNKAVTKLVAEAGREHNVFVEGHYGTGIDNKERKVIDYHALALGVIDFVRATGVDGINYYVGTHHGGGRTEFDAAKLHYVQQALREAGNPTPFGMHGASSLDDAEIRAQRGYFSKLNIATNFVIRYSQLLRDRGELGEQASLELAALESGPNDTIKKAATKKLKKIVCSSEPAEIHLPKLVYEVQRYVELITHT